jgi:hypothetical protein
MIYKQLIKFKILVKQNILAISIILFWFFANLISFTILAGDLTEAFLILFYFQSHSSLYGNFYANFSEFIILIIEEDQEKIEDLMVSNEKQLMMGDPKDVKIFQSLNIENFDCIINTISKVSESIVITKRIRDLNRSYKIFARFFQDSIAEILEKSPFNAEVISSSYDTLNNMKDKGLLII